MTYTYEQDKFIFEGQILTVLLIYFGLVNKMSEQVEFLDFLQQTI